MSPDPIADLIEDFIGPARGDVLHWAPDARCVPMEISKRLRANAEIARDECELRRQVDIVLNDYRNHAWTYGVLYGLKDRLRLGDHIMPLLQQRGETP